MTSRSRALRGTVLRRNRAVLAVGLGLAAAGLAAVVAAALRAPPLIGPGVLVTLVALVVTGALWRGNYWARRQQGAIEASPDGIDLDGERLVSREALSRAAVRRRHGVPPRAQLLDRRGRLALEIELSTEAKVRSLLARARLDPAHSVSEVTLSWYRLGNAAVMVPLTFVPMVVLAPLIMGVEALLEWLGVPGGSLLFPLVIGGTLLAAAVGAVALYLGSCTRLRVGPDGVNVRRWGRDRFIPHHQVQAVERWPARRNTTVSEGFDLLLAHGERIRLRTMSQRAYQGDMVNDFIAEAVTAACAAYRRIARGQDLVLLRRGERSVPDWIRALRALCDAGATGYRATAPPRELLWQLLEDPGASAAERAAAAVVLCAGSDAEDCRRVRLAADAVARPALREALLAAAAEDERALQGALASLS